MKYPQTLVADMLHTALHMLGSEAYRDELQYLLDEFVADVNGVRTGTCILALNRLINLIIADGGDATLCHNLISALRRISLVCLPEGDMMSKGETFWQQARIMIGQISEYRNVALHLRAERQAEQLREVGQRLSTTFDLGELMDFLAEQLPELGISGCYLAVFENPSTYQYPAPAPTWSRLMLAYNQHGRISLEPDGYRFPSRQLCPSQAFTQKHAVTLIAQSLYFRENQLGFVLFEVENPENGKIYETLRGLISSALQGDLLVQRIQKDAVELTQKNKELNDFAYVVSHDLKAPLRGIARLAHWLVEDYTQHFDEKGRKMAALLVERVKWMDKLIDGILQYSRVGRIDIEEEPVDLNELIPAVIENLSVPPHIHVSMADEFPIVHYNMTRMFQVFQNLLSNAVKSLDKPQGSIYIGCNDLEDTWQFSIVDNGPGIEKRYHERIFKIFHTINPHNQNESTGIGLALVKKIVKLYGGRVWIESTVGEGSTFWFTLPKK